ncbi:MAG TPA: SCP2 sterol-binding domain-containing protein [Burkholderiaceae bacterium]
MQNNQAIYRLPAPVAKAVSLLPAYPGSLLFVALLNLLVVRHLPRDSTEAMSGKVVRIKVTDAGAAFDFRWQGDGFVACAATSLPDLTIAASAHDFYLLSQRREDPDTLFFARRLAMDGDTDLGLLVKNSLDAIDAPLFSPDSLAPRAVWTALRNRVRQKPTSHPVRAGAGRK